MALFDFLGQPVGGYQSSYSRGEKSLSPRSNVSWGQLLGMLGTSSGRSSDRALGNYIGSQFQLPNQRQPDPLDLRRNDQRGNSDDLSSLVSIIGSLYGMPL